MERPRTLMPGMITSDEAHFFRLFNWAPQPTISLQENPNGNATIQPRVSQEAMQQGKYLAGLAEADAELERAAPARWEWTGNFNEQGNPVGPVSSQYAKTQTVHTSMQPPYPVNAQVHVDEHGNQYATWVEEESLKQVMMPPEPIPVEWEYRGNGVFEHPIVIDDPHAFEDWPVVGGMFGDRVVTEKTLRAESMGQIMIVIQTELIGKPQNIPFFGTPEDTTYSQTADDERIPVEEIPWMSQNTYQEIVSKFGVSQQMIGATAHESWPSMTEQQARAVIEKQLAPYTVGVRHQPHLSGVVRMLYDMAASGHSLVDIGNTIMRMARNHIIESDEASELIAQLYSFENNRKRR